MHFSLYIIVTIFIATVIIYISFLSFIFINSQTDKTCRICQSKDTERVARKSWVKKLLPSKNLYKYWCRKCGNNFYIKGDHI